MKNKKTDEKIYKKGDLLDFNVHYKFAFHKETKINTNKLHHMIEAVIRAYIDTEQY